MKASKFISLDQKNKLWGEYIYLGIKQLGYTFEEFLTKTIYLEDFK